GLSVAFAPCTATSQTSSSERLSPVSSIVRDIGPSLERKSAFEHSTLVNSRNVDAGAACSRVDALAHETHELPVGYLDPAPTCFAPARRSSLGPAKAGASSPLDTRRSSSASPPRR